MIFGNKSIKYILKIEDENFETYLTCLGVSFGTSLVLRAQVVRGLRSHNSSGTSIRLLNTWKVALGVKYIKDI